MKAEITPKHGRTIAIILGMIPYWLLLRWAHNILAFSDAPTIGIGAESALCLTAVAIAIMGVSSLFAVKHLTRMLISNRYIAFTCCCVTSLLCLSSATVFEIPSSLATAIIILRIIMAALSFFLLTITWGLILSQAIARKCYVMLAFSFLLCFFLYNMEDTPGFLGRVLPIAAPTLSALCQLFCPIENKPGLGYSQTITGIDKGFFIVIFLFVMTTGLMRWVLYEEILSFTPQGTSLLFINTASMAVSFIILAVFYKAKSFKWASYLTWIIYTLICFMGLFLMAFLDNGQTALGGSIVLMSRANFGFLLFMVFVACSLKGSSDTVSIFFIIYVLIDSIINLLSFIVIPEMFTVLRIEFSESIAAVSMLVIMVVVGISFVFFAQSTFLHSRKSIHKSDVGLRLPEKKVLAFAETTTLSNREKEILLLLYQGYTYKKIAEVKFISPNTVTTHIKSIYQKLGVHSKQDLIDHINSSESFYMK